MRIVFKHYDREQLREFLYDVDAINNAEKIIVIKTFYNLNSDEFNKIIKIQSFYERILHLIYIIFSVPFFLYYTLIIIIYYDHDDLAKCKKRNQKKMGIAGLLSIWTLTSEWLTEIASYRELRNSENIFKQNFTEITCAFVVSSLAVWQEKFLFQAIDAAKAFFIVYLCLREKKFIKSGLSVEFFYC